MKLHLLSLSVLPLLSALSSCVVAPATPPVVVGTTSGWEGPAASSYVSGVTTGIVGTTYSSSYYRAPYYAPYRSYYGGYGYGRVGYGYGVPRVGNINGGINRVGRR